MKAARFCTCCDQGYAARMRCLHESLRASGEPFVLYVLCFDEATERAVAAAADPSLVSIPWEALKTFDLDYAAVESTRSPIEYIFTTTPVLVTYCLRLDQEADAVTYLDADLWFLGGFSEVLAEQGEASVGIVPHRFAAHLREREKYGLYNVAWVSFRRDEVGLECLRWWREQCLQWCCDQVDGERFADQGYLTQFPRRFSKVKVLDHPGINAAPWNMAGVVVAKSRGGGAVEVDGRTLLFFHFQGVREVKAGWFSPGLKAYGTPLTEELREWVYRPYLGRLAEHQARLRKVGIVPCFSHERLNSGRTVRDRWERFKRRWILPLRGRLDGSLIYAPEPKDEA